MAEVPGTVEMTALITEKMAHLAWCALVALHMARQDGKVSSDVQETLFLTRWLADARRMRLFSRDVAQDIDWLLNMGRKQGIAGKLRMRLEYIWSSCTGNIQVQNDLFRLTYALETANEQGWQYRLLSRREWSGKYQVMLNTSVNSIFIFRPSMDNAFDEYGTQQNLLTGKLSGNTDSLRSLLGHYGWRLLISDNENIWSFTATQQDPESR